MTPRTVNPQILWADDEIELLKPHIMFLQKKGYDVITMTNGQDALDYARTNPVDLVFLDENMPGISGLETLSQLKDQHPDLPVIMITKSEEEDIMNQAIGSRIADYLIKPVLPNQMLMSIKKNLHAREIVQQQQTTGYQQEFGRLSMSISDARTIDEWVEVYKRLVFWENEFSALSDPQLSSMLQMQKDEADTAFFKFVKKNYQDWIQPLVQKAQPQKFGTKNVPSSTKSGGESSPLLSPSIFKERVFPLLDAGEKLFFIVIDNFRLDQWRAVQPLLSPFFNCQEDVYCSILPTATQYARNAIFSGLLPDQIAQMFPDLWVDEDEEEGKNLNEAPLIQTQLDRFRKPYQFSYHKVNENSYGERLVANLKELKKYPLNVVVINFVDMLSHARTEVKTVRELAHDEAAYRALTRTWMEHSFTLELFRQIAAMGYKVILTTDHGSIRCDNAVKIVGDKNVNTNLRYKLGKNLNSQSKQLYWIERPQEFGLPVLNLSTQYAFCGGHDFFAYPNNYNYYVQYYKDTFQHGGISLEEMLIPLITLSPK